MAIETRRKTRTSSTSIAGRYPAHDVNLRLAPVGRVLCFLAVPGKVTIDNALAETTAIYKRSALQACKAIFGGQDDHQWRRDF
jgi:hypothetical protein